MEGRRHYRLRSKLRPKLTALPRWSVPHRVCKLVHRVERCLVCFMSATHPLSFVPVGSNVQIVWFRLPILTNIHNMLGGGVFFSACSHTRPGQLPAAQMSLCLSNCNLSFECSAGEQKIQVQRGGGRIFFGAALRSSHWDVFPSFPLVVTEAVITLGEREREQSRKTIACDAGAA